MESTERELIEKALSNNFELKKLYTQHSQLQIRLEQLSNLPFLTADEQIEVKKLKHQKLRGVERMIQIIRAGEEDIEEQQAA